MQALRTRSSSIGTFPKIVIETDIVAAVILWHTANQSPRHHEARLSRLRGLVRRIRHSPMISLLILVRRLRRIGLAGLFGRLIRLLIRRIAATLPAKRT